MRGLKEKTLAGLKWLYMPANALPVCMAAGFLLPTNAAWSTFFYIIAWPTVVLGVWKGWRPDWSNRAAMALLALWGWSSLAILWGERAPQGGGLTYWLLSAASTLSLVLCFLMAAQANPKTKDRVIAATVWSAVIAVILSLGLSAYHHESAANLMRWGALHLPVLGAAAVVVCVLLALSRVVKGQFYYLAALVPLLVYLPINGSRMAFLALFCGLVVAAMGNRKACLSLFFAIAGLGGTLGILYGLHFDPLNNFISVAVARGSDCHVKIWHAGWELFLKRPLLGYGPAMRLPIQPDGYCPPNPGPHDIYLSLLVYSGLVGFVLFWLCQITALQRLLRLRVGIKRQFDLALMSVPLLAGLTDLNQIIKGPSPLWYIIWLPLLLVASLPESAPKSSGRSPASSGLPPRG